MSVEMSEVLAFIVLCNVITSTNKRLHLFGKLKSPRFNSCDSTKDRRHIICDCRALDTERATFTNTLRPPHVSPGDSNVPLFPTGSREKRTRIRKALIDFLEATNHGSRH